MGQIGLICPIRPTCPIGPIRLLHRSDVWPALAVQVTISNHLCSTSWDDLNMRLGVFGGSFDPVHYGHLLLAESCREQCGLDEVWFVPAATPPHKQGRDMTPARQRVDMLQLAIGGTESFHVSTIEIDRGGVSYTV